MRAPYTWLAWLALCLAFVSADRALGQTVENSSVRDTTGATSDVSEADSTRPAVWNSETYFEIERLRLERWLRGEARTVGDTALVTEVLRLKQEAEAYAARGEFMLASIWLETAQELIETFTAESEESVADSTSRRPSATRLDAWPESPRFTWRREILSGVDLWRYRFDMNFLNSDTTQIEGNGNPFTALRLDFDYRPNATQRLSALAFFRYSRDYLSGHADLGFTADVGRSFSWALENRFEATSFYGDFDLRYVQNKSSLSFAVKSLGPFNFEVDEAFAFRRYAQEDSLYPNYLANRLGGALTLRYGISSSLRLGHRYQVRRHPNFNFHDYTEHVAEFSWVQSLGTVSRLFVEDYWSFRDYGEDRGTSFPVDFWDNYARAMMTLQWTDHFGLEAEGSFIRRDYAAENPYTLDYNFWEIEARPYVTPGANWKIGAGFYYSEQVHEQKADVAGLLEDYRAWGPTLSIEFLDRGGTLFSLRHTFVMKRHPEVRRRDLSLISLYSDSNIHSLLFLFTWPFLPRWQLNVLANVDDDRSLQDQEALNTQNALVSFELTYSF